jgi:hypothetical protein
MVIVVVPERKQCPWGRGKQKLDVNEISTAEKTWLGSEVAFFGKSGGYIKAWYGISAATVCRWARLLKNGLTIKESGRPKLVSDERRKEMTRSMEDRKYQPKEGAEDDPFDVAVKNTALDRGVVPRTPSRRTKSRTEKACGIKTTSQSA